MSILDPTVEDYVAGVLAGDRTVLSRAVTLIESQSTDDEKKAQKVLNEILPHTGKSKRIGITGSPGVGKSTFIEVFGCYVIEEGNSVAVLTIDQSSKLSGGSILGDKTRMENLSREPHAFIRPSPSGDSVGGLARRTRETILLCQAAGFDLVLIESIGVGQSEVALRSVSDYFLLLLLPGAGDELQGIKRGIIEMADDILVTKADGDNRQRAQQARLEQQTSLMCMQPPTPPWKPEAALCSAVAGDGIPEAWQRMQRFFGELAPKGVIEKRRQQQAVDWLTDLIHEELQRRFDRNQGVQGRLPQVRDAVRRGEMTAFAGSRLLLVEFDAPPQKIDYDNKN